MRRLLAILVVMALWTSTAAAHALTLIAAVSTVGDTVQVRLLDSYGAPVPGAVVTLGFGQPGAAPSRQVKPTESEPGLFLAQIQSTPGEVFELTVDVAFVGDQLRSSIRLRQGENMEEKLLPLAVVGHEGQVNWNLYLLLGVGIALVTATVAALLRKRVPDAPEEG